MRKNLIAPLFVAACLAGAGLHADTDSAVYLLAAGDAKLLTNSDANNYFATKPGQIAAQGYGDGDVRLGLQFGRWAALEASFNMGPFRNYQVVNYASANNAFTSSNVTTNWTLYTYSLTPGVTWAGPGFVNFLGIRFGVANLGGHVNDVSGGADGSYDQYATTPDIGVLFRTSSIFVDHISVGLELGYDYTYFNTVNNDRGTGTYTGITGASHNANGSATQLNFSGPHIGIVLGLWSNAPVRRHDHDDAAPQSPAE